MDGVCQYHRSFSCLDDLFLLLYGPKLSKERIATVVFSSHLAESLLFHGLPLQNYSRRTLPITGATTEVPLPAPRQLLFVGGSSTTIRWLDGASEQTRCRIYG